MTNSQVKLDFSFNSGRPQNPSCSQNSSLLGNGNGHQTVGGGAKQRSSMSSRTTGPNNHRVPGGSGASSGRTTAGRPSNLTSANQTLSELPAEDLSSVFVGNAGLRDDYVLEQHSAPSRSRLKI